VSDRDERGTSEERERTASTVSDRDERGTSEERERTKSAVTPTSLRPQAPSVHTLEQVARLLGLTEGADALGAVQVRGVTHDSRQVQPGDLYVAMLGERAHGSQFVQAAAAAGAVAILTDPLGRYRSRWANLPVLTVPDARAVLGRLAAEIYGNPAANLHKLAVTGTNGKTTTAYLMESGLRASGLRTGVIGTVATRIDDEVLPSARTTPEAPELHALLAVMRERGVEALAMEVSSHALDMHRVDGLRFDVAAFTNLSQDHLDYHFAMEDYFLAKSRLFTPEHAAAAVVNLDDVHGRRIAGQTRLPLHTFSAAGNPAAAWRASELVAGPDGTEFTVTGPGGVSGSAMVSLPGAFNVANAMAAIVSLVVVGISLDDALLGVAACPGVPGRMERVAVGQSFLALVDYAHTPDAVATLLAALRPVTSGRLVVVLGAGGDRDRAKRPLMGEIASRAADVLVLTDDNPRSEDPAAIMAALRSGAESVATEAAAQLHIEHDRAAAIALAVGLARAGDTVVLAGKGHEPGQEVAGVVRPFDDRAVLTEALRSLSGDPAAAEAAT
jgi:UDP-N-acetylmuramoyl-L-alanyl-D-glutamate--2,6-diaminopimelate ligase